MIAPGKVKGCLLCYYGRDYYCYYYYYYYYYYKGSLIIAAFIPAPGPSTSSDGDVAQQRTPSSEVSSPEIIAERKPYLCLSTYLPIYRSIYPPAYRSVDLPIMVT